MESVPTIDRDELEGDLRRCLPDAAITVETINPDCGSWEIAIKRNGRQVNIAWGPLSGFGTTDLHNLREDNNPFASHDWPMESAEAAIEFVVRVVGGGIA
jgi:hypothetical protein